MTFRCLTLFSLFVLLLGCSIVPATASAQVSGKAAGQVEGIPYTWSLSANAVSPSWGPGNRLAFGAAAETDLHYPASGVYRRRNAPMALFTPLGDFEFSAQVVPGFDSQWDGGALLLYADTLHWAKILLQLSGTQPLVGMSVVSKGLTDDAYYPAADSGSMYFKISRAGKLYSFHTSPNGTVWTLARQFLFDPPAPVQLGFYVQSPTGKGSRVLFSDILFVAPKQ